MNDDYPPSVHENPYAAPRAEPSRASAARAAITRSGKELHLGRDRKLKPVCLACGTQDGVVYEKKTFSYTPPIRFLAGIFGVIGMAATSSLQRSHAVSLPLCAKCNRRQGAADVAGPVNTLGGTILVVAAATAAGNGAPWLGLGILVVGAVGATIFYRAFGRAKIRCAYLDDDKTALANVDPAAIEKVIDG